MFTAVFIGPELALKQWPKHAALLCRATRPILDYMSLRLWQPKLSVKRNLRATQLAPISTTLRLDSASVNLTGNDERYIRGSNPIRLSFFRCLSLLFYVIDVIFEH